MKLLSAFVLSFVVIAIASSPCAAVVDVKGLATPNNQEKLDSAFFIPSGQAFSVSGWRDHNDRFAMLFDIHSMNLIGRPRHEVEDHLGKADIDGKYCRYDLGKVNGIAVWLELHYDAHDKLLSMDLIQTDERGFCTFSPSWRMTNFLKKKMAADLNQSYFLVGAPIEAVPSMLDFSQDQSNPNHFKICGPYEHSVLEIVADPNTNRVSRFRFLECVGERTKAAKYSEWQRKDLRSDPRSFATITTCEQLPWIVEPDLMNVGRVKFSSELWKSRKQQNEMLSDFLRSYAVIGMSRSDIRKLLGEPDSTDDFSSTEVTPELLAKNPSRTEQYRLTYGRCGYVPKTYFQLLYSAENKVCAYRKSTVDFGSPVKELHGKWLPETRLTVIKDERLQKPTI